MLGDPHLFEPGPCASPIGAAQRNRFNAVANQLAAVTAEAAPVASAA